MSRYSGSNRELRRWRTAMITLLVVGYGWSSLVELDAASAKTLVGPEQFAQLPSRESEATQMRDSAQTVDTAQVAASTQTVGTAKTQNSTQALHPKEVTVNAPHNFTPMPQRSQAIPSILLRRDVSAKSVPVSATRTEPNTVVKVKEGNLSQPNEGPRPIELPLSNAVPQPATQPAAIPAPNAAAIPTTIPKMIEVEEVMAVPAITRNQTNTLEAEAPSSTALGSTTPNSTTPNFGALDSRGRDSATNATPIDVATSVMIPISGDSATIIQYGATSDEILRGDISIEQLAQIALAQNPTLAQASRLLDQARGNHTQVGLYPNPVVGYTGGELGDEGSAGKQGGFFQQRIVTGGKLSLNRAVAQSEVDQAYYEVEQQQLRVWNDVRSQAIQVLAAQRLVELDQKLVEIGTQSLTTAERLYIAQEVSRADVLQARVERNTAQLQLDTSRAEYMGAWRQLTALMGDPQRQPTHITDVMEVEPATLNWETSLAALLERSPELARAKAGVQRARHDLERQRAEPIPDVEISGGVLYNDVNGYTIGTAQVGMAIPIFDRNQGAIAAASASISAEMANVQRMELALRERLAQAFREYQAGERQCYRYRTEILPDAMETLRIAQTGYQQGEFTYLQLLTAQRSYFQATRDYIESLRNLRMSTIHIEGLLLTGGLEKIESSSN